MDPIPASPHGASPRPLAAAKPAALRSLPGKTPAGQPQPAGPVLSGHKPALVSLSWAEQDIENRWGLFRGGRYTSVSKAFSFALATLLSTVFLGLMFLLYHQGSGVPKRLAQFFVRDVNNLCATIPATLCFFWGAVTAVMKIPKLRLQRRALDLAAVPQHHDFVLNEATAKTVLERLRSLVDDTSHFILLNRIDRALSSLHNIGGINDVSSILKSQAENDENHIASSYALINAMIWAIPVLGFVGTVLGLSMAMARFNVGNGDAESIKASLGGAIAGLSTAFETTLVGLVFALVLHLLSDLVQQQETDFLDECNDYCHAHVVSKLRVRRSDSKAERPI
jgi:biopolymer transport protein ExbB/TolQ